MDTYDRIVNLARWYASRITWDTRTNGNKFCKFECGDNEPAAKACQRLALAAHGDGEMLPDDWRYAFINEALNAIADSSGNFEELEMEADIYNHELTEWLGSHGQRPSYCDEAVRDGLVSADADMIARISAGQYLEKHEVLDAVLAYLREEAEAEEEIDHGCASTRAECQPEGDSPNETLCSCSCHEENQKAGL
jgi:hypothetical protein